MSTTIQKQLLINLDNLFSGPEKWVRNILYNQDRTAWCILGGMEKVISAMGVDTGSGIIPTSEGWRRLNEIAEERAKAPRYARTFAHDRPICAVSYNNHPATSFKDIKSLIREALDTVDA